MTQKTKREIEATTYPPHVRFTFHRGRVTNGAGQELPDEAYLTYGSAASMNAEDADIEIHGGGAHEAASMIEAAPDMLAALHELEEFLDNQADADDGRPNDAMRHLTEVRAAIARAEGRTDGEAASK